jgi:hypothetical protein
MLTGAGGGNTRIVNGADVVEHHGRLDVSVTVTVYVYVPGIDSVSDRNCIVDASDQRYV